MRKSDALPSKFLRAEDVDDEDLVLTITSVKMESMGDGKEKPVAYFKEKKITGGKGMVINSTNWDIIAGMHGEDSDDWIGQQVTITVEMVTFKGDRVPSLRIVEVRQSRKAGTKVNAAPAARSDKGQPAQDDQDDSDIPY